MANPDLASSTNQAPGQDPFMIPEFVGFVPQFFLDDIIAVAQESTNKAVQSMEDYLTRRSQRRASIGGKLTTEGDDVSSDIEQGLVAFQTLLECHVDRAFDFLEAWSLRNVFAVAPGLPVVAPHQKGLKLENPPERETELFAEIEDLRRKIDNMRKLERLQIRAVRKSVHQLQRSERQLASLSFLRQPGALELLRSLPPQLTTLRSSIQDQSPMDELPQPRPSSHNPASGKRAWETGRQNYESWAIGQLISRARGEDQAGAAVMSEITGAVGSSEDIKAAIARQENGEDPEEET